MTPAVLARQTFNCPVARLLDTLGKRWILLILHQISNGIVTFNAIKRACGAISSRTLNERLKELELNKFIERRITSDRPLKIEYRLTKLGADVQQALDCLGAVARQQS